MRRELGVILKRMGRMGGSGPLGAWADAVPPVIVEQCLCPVADLS